jgi:Uma2 family endonuclease
LSATFSLNCGRSTARAACWVAVPGANVFVAELPDQCPQPDVIVVPAKPNDPTFMDEPIIVVEVISKGSVTRDLTLKRRIYEGMPTIRHYLVVDQRKIAVTHFSRENGWKPDLLKQPGDVIRLEALDVELRLAAIYRGSALA